MQFHKPLLKAQFLGLLHPFVYVWVTSTVLSQGGKENGERRGPAVPSVWKWGSVEPVGRAFSGQQEHCLWTPIKLSQENPSLLGNREGTQPLQNIWACPPLPEGMTHVEMLEENVRAGIADLWLLEHHRRALKEPWGEKLPIKSNLLCSILIKF